MISDVHNRNTGDLPDPLPQVLIASCDDITFVLCDPLYDTVVRVNSLVRTCEPFEATVLDDLQRQFEPPTHLLQFAEHTVWDVGNHFGVETVHETFHHVDFVLNGEVHEIGVDDHVKRRSQLGVVLEKHCRRNLWRFVYFDGMFIRLFCPDFSLLLFNSVIRWFDHFV